MPVLKARVAAIQHLSLPSPYFQKILTRNAEGMKWTTEYSSVEIQFPLKQVLSEQLRVLVGLACHLSVLITHHNHVDPVPTGGTDVLLLTSSNPKILIHFVSKSLIFSSTAILTSYNSTKPALELPNYLKIKSNSKIGPREKIAQLHKYMFQSFKIFPIIYF